ncbi:MAG: hypothetical protein DAHOPDDO_00784 [Ignavibacteriaceae bacterium]|nr:hypothetical protein [Ignavibacteriaceae bacterium]
MRRRKETLKEIAKIAGKIALEIAIIIITRRWKGGTFWK